MTTFYIIRHGLTDAVGKQLTGWMPGIHLNETGRVQAAGLPERFKGIPLAAVYASPLERTRETAEELARHFSISVQLAEEIGEVHYGEWTGRTASDLESDPRWEQYKISRGSYRIPGGETAVEVQARVVGFLRTISERWPDAHVAVVSHGDPIKTAVMHYLQMNIDLFQRLEISPGSVTIIRDDPQHARLLALNILDVGLSRYSTSA